jgi:glycosyltransferase involved in cell wall biosynthesis
VAVTVAVCTYGYEHWARLGHRTMRDSLSHGPVVHSHRDTLHDARNAALRSVETEWVVFLDADDRLEPGYLDAMSQGTADLRAPAVRYVEDGVEAEPRMPQVVGHRHTCDARCLDEGNWLVIGTMARTQLLRDVGGWKDWPIWEDWDLWLRCAKAGATVEAIPTAVYRATVRDGSRNVAALPIRKRTFRQIRAANL